MLRSHPHWQIPKQNTCAKNGSWRKSKESVKSGQKSCWWIRAAFKGCWWGRIHPKRGAVCPFPRIWPSIALHIWSLPLCPNSPHFQTPVSPFCLENWICEISLTWNRGRTGGRQFNPGPFRIQEESRSWQPLSQLIPSNCATKSRTKSKTRANCCKNEYLQKPYWGHATALKDLKSTGSREDLQP